MTCPSVEEMKKDLPEDWMCNVVLRCYPDEYYNTCDWGGIDDWAGKEISCDSENAVQDPCPNPKIEPCLIEGIKAQNPCDNEAAGCSCNTIGKQGGIHSLLMIVIGFLEMLWG